MTLEEIRQFLMPVLILVLFVVGGYLLSIWLNVYVTRLARKTKTKVDDIIVDAVKLPIVIVFFVIGARLALEEATFLPYYAEIMQYFPVISQLLIIMVAAWCISRIVTGVLKYYGVARPGLKTLVPLLQKLTKILIYTAALIMVLNALGIQVTALVAGFGIGGIAIALALQGTLSEFFSGLYIMSDRPIRVGDYVELDSGLKGYVKEIGWRSTKIQDIADNMVVVPNSKLAGSTIINYYMPAAQMSVRINVGVSYDSDLDKVERVAIEVGKEVVKKVTGSKPEVDPFIRYHTFDDFSINFTVILRAGEYMDKYMITHEFVKALHRRFRKEGIEIPFPIRTVIMPKPAPVRAARRPRRKRA